jgi:hypothetical protein
MSEQIKAYNGTGRCEAGHENLKPPTAQYVVFWGNNRFTLLCATDAATWASANHLTLPDLEGSKEEELDNLTLYFDDPFEYTAAQMVMLNRMKRADYAKDDDPFSNFRRTAESMGIEGFGPLQAVQFNLAQKIARLRALAENGRAPRNEAVRDTWLDLAVYAAIGYTLATEEGA